MENNLYYCYVLDSALRKKPNLFDKYLVIEMMTDINNNKKAERIEILKNDIETLHLNYIFVLDNINDLNPNYSPLSLRNGRCVSLAAFPPYKYNPNQSRFFDELLELL